MAARILSVTIIVAIIFACFWLLLVQPMLAEINQALAAVRR